MPKIDESRPFIPVNIAILTVSDTRTTKEDKSGASLEKMLTEALARLVFVHDRKTISCARSIAARRLPESALPVPARSNAVP